MPDGFPNPVGPGQRSFSGDAEASTMDDLALLSGIRSGRQDAMTAFFDRYSRMVYSVAMRVLNDSSEAEDVMQETFIRVWQNPGAFTAGRGSLGGWLMVVTRNRAIDRLRRRKPTDPTDMFTLPSSISLANESERVFLLEKVRNVMAALPEEQRKALEMAFFEGRTHSEIAEKTGEPLGTIKTRIRLALIAIRKELKV